MKNLLRLLFVLALVVSCSSNEIEETTECDFNNGNIAWLNEKIERFEESSNPVEVYEYTYNEETVFLIKDCIDCSDALELVYNCSGEIICEFGGISGLNTCIDFETEASNKELVWTNINESNQVIIDNERYNNISTEEYQIKNTSIDGDILSFSIEASGCSGDSWRVNLIDEDLILESLPVQRSLKIDMYNNEACLAVFTKEYEIDVSSLQVNGETIVHFNLEGWGETIVYNYGEENSLEELLIGNWSDGVISVDAETITFEKVTEFTDSFLGFTFKEQDAFPSCIEKPGVCSDTSCYLDRTWSLEGDILSIYDTYTLTIDGAESILLYQYKIISIDENELVVEIIEENEIREFIFTEGHLNYEDFLITKGTEGDDYIYLEIGGSRNGLALTSEIKEFELPYDGLGIRIVEWDKSPTYGSDIIEIGVEYPSVINRWNVISGTAKISIDDYCSPTPNIICIGAVFTVELKNIILEHSNGEKVIIEELIINSSWPGFYPG